MSLVSGLPNDICCPFTDQEGDNLYILRSQAGLVLKVDETGNTQTVVQTGGQPSGAAIGEDGLLYVTDFAHAAVLAYPLNQDGSDNAFPQQDLVVGVYEDRPLKGPNSITIVDGEIFFTDSGPIGDTGLNSPYGSVYIISSFPNGQVLRPISYNNLAYPSGIAISKDKNFIFVCETMANRVIRYTKLPGSSSYHGSVFLQLQGGVGPISLVYDDTDKNLYVGVYDVPESSPTGRILVVNTAGITVTNLEINGPEISGMTIAKDTLYVTEKSTGSIYQFPL